MAQGKRANFMEFANIPISIVLGVLPGVMAVYMPYLFFEPAYAYKHCVRNSIKVIIVLGCSFLLLAPVFRTCGVLGMDCTYQKFLCKEEKMSEMQKIDSLSVTSRCAPSKGQLT